MSVSYKGELSSSNLNTAFASKTQNNTLAGVQTFSGKTIHNGGADFDGVLTYAAVVDSSTTGSGQSISPTDIHVKLTHASLTSINNIGSPTSGKIHVLTNGKSSGVLSIVNNSGGTAANRIITGTGADLSLANGASVILIYDNNSTRWRVVGGSGGGSGWTESSQQTLAASGTITITTSDQFQQFIVAGNGAAVTLSSTPFGTSPPSAAASILVIGNSDTNTVSITFNDAANGCVGNFSTITLAKYETALFNYSPTQSRYVYVP
jgi:hypothetical protein